MREIRVTLLTAVTLCFVCAGSVSAQGSELKSQILPIGCQFTVIDTGTNQIAYLTPTACGQAIPTLRNQSEPLLGPSGLTIERGSIDFTRTNSESGANILSLTYNQPIADGRAIANVSTSTATSTQEVKWQNVTAGAGVVAAATAIVVDGVFFGFASMGQIGNSISANVQKMKSVFGKSSGP